MIGRRIPFQLAVRGSSFLSDACLRFSTAMVLQARSKSDTSAIETPPSVVIASNAELAQVSDFITRVWEQDLAQQVVLSVQGVLVHTCRALLAGNRCCPFPMNLVNCGAAAWSHAESLFATQLRWRWKNKMLTLSTFCARVNDHVMHIIDWKPGAFGTISKASDGFLARDDIPFQLKSPAAPPISAIQN